jgi:hypothetical protein
MWTDRSTTVNRLQNQQYYSNDKTERPTPTVSVYDSGCIVWLYLPSSLHLCNLNLFRRTSRNASCILNRKTLNDLERGKNFPESSTPGCSSAHLHEEFQSGARPTLTVERKLRETGTDHGTEPDALLRVTTDRRKVFSTAETSKV